MKKPQICLSITGKTEEDVIKQLTSILFEKPDLIEVRGDFLSYLDDTNKVLESLNLIKTVTSIPLLFTIRSVKEGGEPISLSDQAVVSLLEAVIKLTDVEWIDYEVMQDRGHLVQIEKLVKSHDKNLILSYHNFDLTPEPQELLSLARTMERLKADHAKIAVMPRDKIDVYNLLNVTAQINEHISIPITTMSMGELGKMSRVIGFLYGSKITFGKVAQGSAPGQIEVKDLRSAISALNKALD